MARQLLTCPPKQMPMRSTSEGSTIWCMMTRVADIGREVGSGLRICSDWTSAVTYRRFAYFGRALHQDPLGAKGHGNALFPSLSGDGLLKNSLISVNTSFGCNLSPSFQGDVPQKSVLLIGALLYSGTIGMQSTRFS